jgi:hypothetical protein
VEIGRRQQHGRRESTPVKHRKRVTHFFKTFNGLVDLGLRQLSRSEIAAYLVLLRDTKQDGTACTSYNDIAERGGMSRMSAIRAVRSLLKRGAIEVVRRGGRGIGSTTYRVVPGGTDVFRNEQKYGNIGDTTPVTPDV